LVAWKFHVDDSADALDDRPLVLRSLIHFDVPIRD